MSQGLVDETKFSFDHSVVDLTTDILGGSRVGPHWSVLTDRLDSVREYEVSDIVPVVALCTFGLEPGLPRSSHSLASAITTCPALRLARQLADELLSSVESLRHGA